MLFLRKPFDIMVTQKEKRFLIVWFLVITFAYLCNTVPISGTIVPYQAVDEQGYQKTAIYLFSANGWGGYSDSDFWPFVDYTDDYDGTSALSNINSEKYPVRIFNGIFASFNGWEFIIYAAIGLGIVFLPKIWK
jgi:hypothetical protein